MDKLTGNQSHRTGADDLLLQSGSSQPAQPDRRDSLEDQIIAQSLDFKDWVAQVQTNPASRGKLTAKQASFFGQPAKASSPLSKLSKQLRATVNGQSLVELSEVEISVGDGNAFWGGNLENPKEGDRVCGNATLVSGWVIARQSRAAIVCLVSEGKTIAEAPIALDRPDVKKVYSLAPHAQESGFCLTLNFEMLPQEGTIEVKVVLADQSSLPMGSFKFNKYTGLF
jgi:hypothetical protein